MDKFILTIPDAFTAEYCQEVIDYFESCSKLGLTLNRQRDGKSDANEKSDNYLFANGVDHSRLTGPFIRHFTNVFWNECYPQYCERFPVLNTFDPHAIYDVKIQCTEPGQGYHIWHCESSSRINATRILAWMLYLNTVEEGGETEFLYQHCRVKPTQGTLVIWPATFTHTHRGNPPLSGVKYIVTGCVEF